MIHKTDLKELLDYLLQLGLVGETIYHNLLSENPLEPVLCKVQDMDSENNQVNSLLTIRPGSGGYCVDGYRIELVKVPVIRHTVYHGMDTAQLEQRLAEINWRGLGKEALSEEHINLLINDVIYLRLVGTSDVQDIADALRLKYWSASPVRDTLDFMGLEDYTTSFETKLHGDLNDIGFVQAYNLLRGRCLMRFCDFKPEFPPDFYWLKLENGNLTKYPAFDINGALRALPISPELNEETIPRLRALLFAGQKVKVPMKVDGKIDEFFIEVDAAERIVAISNNSGERVKLPELEESGEKLNPKSRKVKSKRPGI